MSRRQCAVSQALTAAMARPTTSAVTPNTSAITRDRPAARAAPYPGGPDEDGRDERRGPDRGVRVGQQDRDGRGERHQRGTCDLNGPDLQVLTEDLAAAEPHGGQLEGEPVGQGETDGRSPTRPPAAHGGGRRPHR